MLTHTKCTHTLTLDIAANKWLFHCLHRHPPGGTGSGLSAGCRPGTAPPGIPAHTGITAGMPLPGAAGSSRGAARCGSAPPQGGLRGPRAQPLPHPRHALLGQGPPGPAAAGHSRPQHGSLGLPAGGTTAQPGEVPLYGPSLGAAGSGSRGQRWRPRARGEFPPLSPAAQPRSSRCVRGAPLPGPPG